MYTRTFLHLVAVWSEALRKHHGLSVSMIYSYAFDISIYSGQPFMANRRLFAMADTGIPDGIKCDMNGNVYSGCGDGVNVWSPGGVLLGKVLVEGGVANFCFGGGGEMFILNENRIWRAKLSDSVKGALLKI
jgi:gluconolactonase